VSPAEVPLVPAGVLVGLLGVLGLLVGSFLNVVIHRVPAGLSIASPPSACPGCAHPVRPRDNVPVVSWLLLRGRCRDCAVPISGRYPLVELATALLFVLVGLRFGASTYTGAALAVTAAGVALFMIDLDHRRLPFSITAAAAVGTLIALGVDVALNGVGVLGVAVLSMGVWLAVYGGIWLGTAGRGMGLGDVALAPVLGLALGWLGWGPSLVGLAGGFLVGAVVGVALIATGVTTRRARVPHGPFLLSGAALGMFAGEPLWQGYLRLTGLA
jgi:leader peptidase (prepilin peptidase)/N-methyltransferase